MKLKLMIVGYARHGKDSVCEILNKQYGYSFQSSSMFCAELFIFETLKNVYGYSTVEQCFLDRHNHSQEWFQLIKDYNMNNAAKLGNELYKKYDIYCGLRSKREFHALKNSNSFTTSIWVDRSDYLPPEPRTSMDIEPWMADYIIDNNTSLKDLEFNTAQLMDMLIARSVQ